MTLNKLSSCYTLACAAVAILSVAASAQQPASTLLAPMIHGTALAPNFRVADFKVVTPDDAEAAAPDAADAEAAAPDPLPDSPSTPVHQGFIKRSFIRIGQDQKRLYLAPLEAHNLKWDAIVL